MADIIRDVFLAFVRVHLLHHASEGPIYGLQMMEELGRHGYTLSPGTLYPIFHSLEEGGLLESQSTVVDGKSPEVLPHHARGSQGPRRHQAQGS